MRRTPLIALLFMVIVTPAHAYIGPVVGLGAIGAVLALFLGAVLLVVGFLWYPLKRILKARKSASVEKPDPGDGIDI